MKSLRIRFTTVVIITLFLAFSFLTLPSFPKIVKEIDSSAFTPSVWPKSPTPSTTVDSVTVGNNPNSEGVSVAAVAGFQARTQPKIYYIISSQDQSWLNYLAATYGVVATSRTQDYILTTYDSLFTSSGHQQIIEYSASDPNFPMQLDMARTLASVDNALPVSSSAYSHVSGLFPMPNLLLNVNSLPCISAGDPKLACFSYLLDQVNATMSTSMFTIASNGRLASTDYYVENKLFEFFFSQSAGHAGPTSAEMTFTTTRVFPFYPANTPVGGFFGLGGESNTIRNLSQAQLSQTIDELSPDRSFFSGYANINNVFQPAETMPVYNSHDVYLDWAFTQGDAVGYNQYNILNWFNQTDPACNCLYRTEFPVTFQLSPQMAQLMPPILHYYYTHVTNETYFITGPTAGLYARPDLLPNENSFGSIVWQFGNNSNMPDQFVLFANQNPTQTVLTAWANSAGQPQDIFNYQSGCPNAKCRLPILLNSRNTTAFFGSGFVPSIATFTSADVTNMVESIEDDAANFNFVNPQFNYVNPGMGFVKAVDAQLPVNYVEVTAEQYACLYKQSIHVECPNVTPPPPRISVSLAANTTVTKIGTSIALTATSSVNVGSFSYTINIMDVTNSTIVHSCTTGTSCSINVKSNVPITLIYSADIINASSYILASAVPLTLTWTSSTNPMLILTSNATYVPINTVVLLTATLSGLPSNQTTYSILIIDLHNDTTIKTCSSGIVCNQTVVSRTAYTDTFIGELLSN